MRDFSSSRTIDYWWSLGKRDVHVAFATAAEASRAFLINSITVEAFMKKNSGKSLIFDVRSRRQTIQLMRINLRIVIISSCNRVDDCIGRDIKKKKINSRQRSH